MSFRNYLSLLSEFVRFQIIPDALSSLRAGFFFLTFIIGNSSSWHYHKSSIPSIRLFVFWYWLRSASFSIARSSTFLLRSSIIFERVASVVSYSKAKSPFTAITSRNISSILRNGPKSRSQAVRPLSQAQDGCCNLADLLESALVKAAAVASLEP